MQELPEYKASNKWRGPRMSICLLLLLSTFFTSCKGQEKTNVPEDDKVESPTPPQQPFVDRMFFIEGQLCQHVRKIFQDESGNLWFGTNVYGLMRYDGDTLVYYSDQEGVGGRITGIVEDNEGNVWVGTAGGLTQYDGQSFTNFSDTEDELNDEIWSLIIDQKGEFWIGTNQGVLRFDGESFTAFQIPKAKVRDTTTIYSYDRITSVLEDRKGVLWFGTDGFGICTYDPLSDTFTQITMEDGLCDNNIGSLHEDKQGNIWIGTMFGGVSRYDGTSFTNFTQDGVITGVEVGGFWEDEIGNIWFAAENHGVYRYETASGEFVNFNQEDGLITNGILSIYQDREGRFWLGGWGGLFRYDLSAEQAGGASFFSVTKEGPWD